MFRSKPKLLDLFCGAGVGAIGYIRAGFEVVGVDVVNQPNYPGKFIHGDAFEMLDRMWTDFDVIHLSPPCQAFTRAKHLRKAQGGKSRFSDDLLRVAIGRVKSLDPLWVIENVPGAPEMEDATVLCGSSFGLEVRRHRLFLSNFPIPQLLCRHKEQGRPWGVYHVPNDNIPKGGRTAIDVNHGHDVMGVERGTFTWDELKEGLPPAYTQHVGNAIRTELLHNG